MVVATHDLYDVAWEHPVARSFKEWIVRRDHGGDLTCRDSETRSGFPRRVGIEDTFRIADEIRSSIILQLSRSARNVFFRDFIHPFPLQIR